MYLKPPVSLAETVASRLTLLAWIAAILATHHVSPEPHRQNYNPPNVQVCSPLAEVPSPRLVRKAGRRTETDIVATVDKVLTA